MEGRPRHCPCPLVGFGGAGGFAWGGGDQEHPIETPLGRWQGRGQGLRLFGAVIVADGGAATGGLEPAWPCSPLSV